MDGIAEKTRRGSWLRRLLMLSVCIPLLLLISYGFTEAPKPLPVKETAAAPARPLTEDEQAALRWLDHVLGPLPEAEERKWWNTGKHQFGLSSTRYHIAFAGYAAAALGIRGNAEQKATVGRILENCIRRYLKREVWAYRRTCFCRRSAR